MSKKDRHLQKEMRIRARGEKQNEKAAKMAYRKLHIGTEEWKKDNKEEKLEKINKVTMSKN